MIRLETLIALAFAPFCWLLVQEPHPHIRFDDRVFGGSTQMISYVLNQKFVVELPETPRGPTWSKDMKSPPLSAADAIRTAIKKRKELISDSEHLEWGLAKASLIPWKFEDGHWYWEIVSELHVKHGGSSGPPVDLRLVVLMDGTIADTEVKPYDRQPGG